MKDGILSREEALRKYQGEREERIKKYKDFLSQYEIWQLFLDLVSVMINRYGCGSYEKNPIKLCGST